MSGLILSLRASSAGAAKSTALWLLLAVLASESRLCSARLPGLQTRTQDCPIGQKAWTGDRDFFLSGRAAAAELFGGNFSCGTAAWGPRKCMDSGQAAAGPGSQQDGAIRDEARGAAAGAQASGDNNMERAVPETKDQDTQTEEAAEENRQGISCKDHNGENVDWFFAIKQSQSERLIYVASNRAEERRWIQVDDVWNASPVSNTYHQERDRVTTKLFEYNDHPSGQAARNSGAHMKGIILHGTGIGDSGFWMLHSVPQFPDVVWSNIDGQSFFCVTLNRLEIKKIKTTFIELNTISPTFYHPDELRSEYQKLQTRNGEVLHIKGKYPFTATDIYDQIKVNDGTLTRVRVQNYRLGASPPLPCNEKLTNVAATKFLRDENPLYGMLFSQDNSKCSIGEIAGANGESRKFFCAGDLDRVKAHLERGGCLVCMENQWLWRLLHDAIGLGGQLNNQGHHQPPEFPNAGTCKITENQRVDWFIVVQKNGNHIYRYLSSQNDSNWKFSNKNGIGPLDWTLDRANAAGLQKHVYNDHHPGKNSSRSYNGHAKGVFVVGNPTGGFWLMHSMPRFPVLTLEREVKDDFWPKNKYDNDILKYAQIFLCVTFQRTEAKKISKQIKLMKEHKMYNDVSNFGEFPQGTQFHSTRLVSHAGVEFVHISKSPDYRVDVYETVSDLIGIPLYVQGFTPGDGGPLDPTPRITQITETKFYKWEAVTSGSDHSKWCVAHQDATVPYFCIGDLNRKESQLKRGGGVLCLLNRNVHQKFRWAIKQYKSENPAG